MKIQTSILTRKSRGLVAFTLTEMLVATTIFSMVIGGVVYAHITGLKMFEWVRVKVGASEDARKTMTRLVSEVRGSQDWYVGDATATTFTPVADGDDQEGNAVQVLRSDWNATLNPNSFIIYYINPNNACMMRREGPTGKAVIVARSLTNEVAFSATDHRGVVRTSRDATQVLGVLLEFYQIRYPIVEVGTNKLFEYYKMSTRICRRSM